MRVCSIAIAARYVRRAVTGGLVIFTIRTFERTASTNDDAVPLLGIPEHAGAVLVAGYQSAGRGRRARAWIAPPGSSLLCTALLPRALATAALWAVPFWTALGVAEGIEAATGLRVALQWPNDLLLDGGKCCGILCISRVTGERAYVGCGVGLNVTRPALDPALAAIVPPPAFLSDRAPDPDRDALLRAILAAYERRLDDLDDPRGIARAWEARARLAGTAYRLQIDGEAATLDATARRLDDDGSLIVADPRGNERRITLADARVVRER